MKLLRMAQGSPEWHSARLGVVTASEIDALVSPTYEVRKGEGVTTYLCQKLSEKIMGYRGESGSTWAMDNGSIVEKIALPWFSFTHDVSVDRAGFCVSDDGRIGFSPDGLIGDDGGIEVKSPLPPKHIRNLDAGLIPAEYRCQVQFSLYVSRRKWWKFLSFHPHLPPLLVEAVPDQKAFTAFDTALLLFFTRFDAAHAKITGMMQQGGR